MPAAQDSIHVLPVGKPAKLRPGRPKNRPELSCEMVEAMSAEELDLYRTFMAAYEADYGPLSATEFIGLQQAALDYISLWRTQTWQLSKHEVLTASRQNPGTSLRSWVDQVIAKRKADALKKKPDTNQDDEMRQALLRLSQGA